ncbi:ankyrin [Paramyrothecium foliicola]|nr:ankyrin [Paramyrothecium foliicola]
MAQLTEADLKDYPGGYDSSRDVGDVLIGEDTARPLIEASSSGDDTAVQNLLSQPQWIKTALEQTHRIYNEHNPAEGSNDTRWVTAMRMLNLQQAVTEAAKNGHAAVVSTLLSFAKQHGIHVTDVIDRRTIYNIFYGGHAAVFKAIGSADPNIINFPLGHANLPLYEAVRLRQPDVVAVLLELGADPFHPVQSSKRLWTYNSSLLSRATFAKGPRMTEMLLERGVPVANTGALHAAARLGYLDTMRLLMRYGADVNETISGWDYWAPIHFAASRGQVDAMKLLEQSGADPDMKDVKGKTPAQVLEEYPDNLPELWEAPK